MTYFIQKNKVIILIYIISVGLKIKRHIYTEINRYSRYQFQIFKM